jgi:hypothetical protein
MSVTIREASYVIVHVPDFVRYGSKPSRDIEENPGLRSEEHTSELQSPL